MKNVLKTTIATIALMALTAPAHAAAYKVTVDGKSETVCHASTAAWAMYNAGKEGEATVSVTKMDTDSAASKQCDKVATKKRKEREAVKQSAQATPKG